MRMSKADRDDTIARYDKRLKTYGYSPKTLGWDKGKQDIRFEVLTSQYDFAGKSILDIGCGFGDLNKILIYRTNNRYTYHGVDLVENLVVEGRRLYQGPHITFEAGDFLQLSFPKSFDYAIASGIFNHKLKAMDNYKFAWAVMKKALAVCLDGFAFDFLSDKVEYRKEDTFHFSPERILSMAYFLSRNVILRNDYMPFEFSVFVFKDDSFAKKDTLFKRYRKAVR